MSINRLDLGERSFNSRLIIDVDNFNTPAETACAIVSSGAEIVAFPARRTNIGQMPDQANFLDIAPPDNYTLLPTTAGSYDAKKAVRTCKLTRQLLGGHNLVKLEIYQNENSLAPNIDETIIAAKALVEAGFDVIAYTDANLDSATQLQDAGCIAVVVNSILTQAADSILMASASKSAVEAGHQAFLASAK